MAANGLAGAGAAAAAGADAGGLPARADGGDLLREGGMITKRTVAQTKQFTGMVVKQTGRLRGTDRTRTPNP